MKITIAIQSKYIGSLGDDNFVGQFYETLRNEVSEIWSTYRKRLRKENYYKIKPDLEKHLVKIIDRTQLIIKSKFYYYRARIGTDSLKENKFSFFSKKIPYQDNKISAPPPLQANSGRINREGVSFLYIASQKDTAISEIRPHPGDIVSVGKFENRQDLKLVDFREIDFLKFYKSQKDVELFSFANNLSNEFMKPKNQDNNHHLITQFVAETLREHGQDGVIFNSAVSNGYNLTIFNPELFKYVPDSSKLIKIDKVHHEYHEIEFIKDNFGFYCETNNK